MFHDYLLKENANLPVHITRDIRIFDVGDITCSDGNLEEAQASLGHIVSMLYANKLSPILLGGGHEIAWGHYQGIATINPIKLGIINFDAHFDLRSPLEGNRGTSGSPFFQIAKDRHSKDLNFSYLTIGIQRLANSPSLFRQAEQFNTQIIHADEIHEHGTQQFMRQIDKFIAQHTHIYLTLDLDVFAAACAPGVSAPQALGLYPRQVLALLKHIARSDKVISFDIAELTPQFDEHLLTQQLAAAMLVEYIHHHTFSGKP